ncbi:MAG: stage III sporulation protein AB [Clostridia bacterium]|nr:stage III sporulation protein AB [Clostridia bacterium]
MSTADFLRLIAGGILALVSSYIGLLFKKGYKENTAIYKGLKEFCDQFKTELTYEKTAVIDFCSKFSKGQRGVTDLINEYTASLQKEGQFHRDVENWELAHLKDDEKQEIVTFFNGLGKSPTKEQLAFVEKYGELFKSRLANAIEQEKKKGNMYFKLFVLLGVALMVIVG